MFTRVLAADFIAEVVVMKPLAKIPGLADVKLSVEILKNISPIHSPLLPLAKWLQR